MNNQEIAFFNEHGFAGLFTLLTEEEMKLVYCEILKGINILKFFTNKKYRVYEKRNRHLDLTLISRLCLHFAIGLFWFLCGNEVYTDSFFRKIVLKVLPNKHFTFYKQKLSHKVEKSRHRRKGI